MEQRAVNHPYDHLGRIETINWFIEQCTGGVVTTYTCEECMQGGGQLLAN